jgi:hypothetical protein
MYTLIQNVLTLIRTSRSLLALSILPIVLSMGSIFLPLTRDFDYEFGEALGIITFVTAMYITIEVKRRVSISIFFRLVFSSFF